MYNFKIFTTLEKWLTYLIQWLKGNSKTITKYFFFLVENAPPWFRILTKTAYRKNF